MKMYFTAVRRKTGEVRQPRPTPFGETQDGRGEFIATKGTKGTKGVQLAIARSKASSVCRGGALCPPEDK